MALALLHPPTAMKPTARRAISFSLACALGSVALATSCAPGGGELDLDEASDSQESTLSVKPGDPVLRDGITVIAPERGGGIFAEIILETGETRTLHLRTDLSGQVLLLADVVGEVHDEATDEAEDELEEPTLVQGEAAGEATSSSSPSPCSDGATKVFPFKWNKTFEWSFNAGTTPSVNSVANVETKLKRAAGNITASRNSCGLADQVSATHSYKGRTTTGVQIGADGSCGGLGNGVNTVAFGALPDGVLGLACVWYDGEGHALEADVRLNKGDYKWYADKPSSCSGRWSIEGVATHEFGHVFGLGHVSEAHGNLTMSPQMNGSCQNSEATLGRGDVKALRSKY